MNNPITAPMTAPMTASETTARTLLLRSKPETVHWGYFDGELPPVLTIDSGERVADRVRLRRAGMDAAEGSRRSSPSTTSLSPSKGQARQRQSHSDRTDFRQRARKAGDVLEVKILDIVMRQDWGFNLFRSYMAARCRRISTYYRIIHVGLDRAANLAIMPSGLKVPLSPFFGQLAVAPPKDFGKQNSKEPREFGGNIDCKDLTAG